jgi:drug/metabolite transporter (DMT)-like permease
MTNKFPIPMLIIGGLGAVLMVLGALFTLIGTTSGEANLVNILFGAFTTAAGFMLVRRTINNRKLLLGNV